MKKFYFLPAFLIVVDLPLLFFRKPDVADAIIVLALSGIYCFVTYFQFIREVSKPDEEFLKIEREIHKMKLDRSLLDARKDLAKSERVRDIENGTTSIQF